MGFFNTGDMQNAPAASVGGMGAADFPSAEAGLPVPYLAGKFPISLKWLADPYNKVARPIISHGPKGFTATTGYTYKADLGAAVCYGPVDAIHEIWVNNERIWTGNVTRADGAEYADITTKLGLVRIYWGSETQPADTLVLAGKGHPAYRGICTLVFKDFNFGAHNPRSPAVKVLISRAPFVPWLNQPMLATGANPAHVAIELASDPRAGFALPYSEWSVARMQELADWCAAKNLGINLALVSASDLGGLWARIAGYFDGWLTNEDGRLGFSSLLYDRDYSTSPIIETSDLSEPLKPKNFAYATAYTHCVLTWSNPAKNYEADTATFHNPGARDLLGFAAPLNLQREWITDQATANQTAAYAAMRGGLPDSGAPVRMLAAAANRLTLGGPFRLRPKPGADYFLNCICQRKTHQGPASREVMVEFIQDTSGFSKTDHVDELYEIEPAEDEGAEAAPAQKVMELPRALRAPGATALTAAMLASRAHALITGGTAWTSFDDTTYSALGPVGLFAATGTLAADLVPGETSLTLDMDPLDMLEIAPQTADQADANSVLVIIGNEIMSLQDYTLLTGDQAQLDNLRRGRYDTAPGAYAAGTRVFILPREWLRLASDPSFVEAADLWFKLTPATLAEQLDLSDATAMELVFAGRESRPLPPGAFTANATELNPTFPTGTDVAMAWTLRKWGDIGFPGSDFYDPATLAVKLEILDAAGTTVKRTANLGAGTTSYTYTTANRLTDFAGVEPVAFQVRVTSKLGTVFSLFAPQLVVTKV